MAGDEQTVVQTENREMDLTGDPTTTKAPEDTDEASRRRVIYLTGPVEHTNSTVAKARRATLGQYARAEWEKEGALVICPLTHWSQFGDEPAADERAEQETLAQSVMDSCSEMVVLLLPGWQDSERLAAEMTRAQEAGIKTKTKGLDALKLEPSTVQTLMGGMRKEESQVELAPGFYAKERVKRELAIETTAGVLQFQMEEDEAPTGVGHMLHLAAEGFYNGTTLHRIIKGHTVQGGCPSGNGQGNAGYECRTEKTKTPYKRGTLALASADPDHNSSQWFIVLKDELKLNQSYTVVGHLTGGEEVLEAIEGAEVLSPNGPNPYQPKEPITIDGMKITAHIERFHGDNTEKREPEPANSPKAAGTRAQSRAKSG